MHSLLIQHAVVLCRQKTNEISVICCGGGCWCHIVVVVVVVVVVAAVAVATATAAAVFTTIV